jgi:hypothetical protein
MNIEEIVYSKYLNGYSLEDIQESLGEKSHMFWMDIERIEEIIDIKNKINEIW